MHIFNAVISNTDLFIEFLGHWWFESICAECFILKYAMPLSILIGKFKCIIQIIFPRLFNFYGHCCWINRLETSVLYIPQLNFLHLDFILMIIRRFAIHVWNKVLFTTGILKNVFHLLRILIQRLKLDFFLEDFIRALKVVLIWAGTIWNLFYFFGFWIFIWVADLLVRAIDQILNVWDANRVLD